MKPEETRILAVDDEEDILEILQYNLEKEGYQVETAMDGNAAISSASDFNPHLIILDIMMPEMDGIETCRLLRNNPKFKETLIAFLTARSEDYSQISGFNVGADDYITKPIKPQVFLSRIKAILKRVKLEDKPVELKVGDLTINRQHFLVYQGENPIQMARKEFEILELLAGVPGRVFSRDEILERIWGKQVIVGDRTIDVHVRKLREKLGANYIKTVKGVGYKLDL